ncbi:hypothetical protein [Nocardia sp. GAS34]|uniref:hypothetical protein n=1 Tax=unclassified Nocardia TaxID=2637762 RepID=UPI003D19A847
MQCVEQHDVDFVNGGVVGSPLGHPYSIPAVGMADTMIVLSWHAELNQNLDKTSRNPMRFQVSGVVSFNIQVAGVAWSSLTA